MTDKLKIGIALAASLISALVGDMAPARHMPLDFDAVYSVSIPAAAAWLAVLSYSLWRFKWRGLWVLVGAPLALHWPIWLLFNHFPPCYYSHNCI